MTADATTKPKYTRIDFDGRPGPEVELEFLTENPDAGISYTINHGCGYVQGSLSIDSVAELRDWLNKHFSWMDDCAEEEPAHD